jgi:molybdenum cofactor cytidylyltransferase
VYPKVFELEGDVGLRALIGKVPLEAVEVEDPGILIDVDTQDDLKKLC